MGLKDLQYVFSTDKPTDHLVCSLILFVANTPLGENRLAAPLCPTHDEQRGAAPLLGRTFGAASTTYSQISALSIEHPLSGQNITIPWAGTLGESLNN